MDWVVILDPGITIEEAIRYREGERIRIKPILDRRESFTDMIDWNAMTELERDWALHHFPYELELELWGIDCDLTALARMLWSSA